MLRNSLLALCLCAIVSLTFTSCKELKDNSPIQEVMKDSIFVVIDEARYARIEIKEHQDVTITIGSKRLFNGSEERRKEVVEQLRHMTVHFFEKNNYLDDGEIIFVPNETRIVTEDDPTKEYEVDFDDLLKK